MRGLKPRSWTYDIWSVDTAARLDAQLRASGRPPGDTQLLHLLRGMTDLCIYPPQQSGQTASRKSGPRDQLLLAWRCTESALMTLILAKDPTGHGLDSVLALRLLQRLLSWHPSARPSAQEALLHAYFTVTEPGPDNGKAHACAPHRQPGWC
ncbi:MAG: hypothetical protein WDW38_003335 [Sanguina aurantia]